MDSGCKYSFNEALLKLEGYCAYQERSTREVVQKAHSWGLSAEQVKELTDHLIENNFLNEERFAEAFVSGKVKIKKWGRLKIKPALRAKGISDSLIQIVLTEIDPDIYQKNLDSLLERKIESLKKDDDFSRKLKTTRYLLSRGFESDLIRDAMDRYFIQR